MFTWLKAKLQRLSSREAKEALQYFVDMLEGADLGGRALTVALATDFRHKVIETSEFAEARQKGIAATVLLQTYRDAQEAELFPIAAGIAVWVHTERAMNDLTLVRTAKEMWALLAESFEFVEEAASGFEMISGSRIDISGYDLIPLDFRN